MTTVTPLSGQSIFDVALMTCGIAEAAYDIAVDNRVSVTDDVVGLDLSVADNISANKRVVEFYSVNKISPATDYD